MGGFRHGSGKSRCRLWTSPQRAENSEKVGREQGVGSSMIILDPTAKATDNIRLKPGGHRVSQHKIQIALPKMSGYGCENQGQGKQASSHGITTRATTGKEQATRSDGSRLW